jgi:acetyltransferase
LYGSPGAELAEFSILVEDQWQGRGVGARLLSRLLEISQELRFSRLWGLVLAENLRMIRLVRSLGGQILCGSDQSQLEIVLHVDKPGAPG